MCDYEAMSKDNTTSTNKYRLEVDVNPHSPNLAWELKEALFRAGEYDFANAIGEALSRAERFRGLDVNVLQEAIRNIEAAGGYVAEALGSLAEMSTPGDEHDADCLKEAKYALSDADDHLWADDLRDLLDALGTGK